MDGSNIYHGMKNYETTTGAPFKIDFLKLVSQLAQGRPLIRALYYNSKKIPPDASQIQFFDYIRQCGIQVIEKELKAKIDPASGAVVRYFEKGVDVALVTDLLGMAWEGVYDVGVLVSGDADYASAVARLMQKGRNIEVVSFKRSCSQELRRAALKTTYIDDLAALIKM